MPASRSFTVLAPARESELTIAQSRLDKSLERF
jgi:hypothetical protein